MEKPDVDAIEGLSPAISIEQKSAGHNPRSTVGTITEVYDYLRLLWARLGTPHCPRDGAPIERQSASQNTDLRSEEHTSELQSLAYLVCRLLLEKKKKNVGPNADGTSVDRSQ